MKVYIVIGSYDYEADYVLEVFSTRELADKYVKDHLTQDYEDKSGKDYYDEIAVEEWEVK